MEYYKLLDVNFKYNNIQYKIGKNIFDQNTYYTTEKKLFDQYDENSRYIAVIHLDSEVNIIWVDKIITIEEYFDTKKNYSHIKKYGYLLQYIKYQTEEMCIEAVSQDGMNLRFVGKVNFPGCQPIEQTNNICLAAILENSLALQYVKPENQTNILCTIAIRYNHQALQYVKNPTFIMCLIAVSKNGSMLKYVNPDNFSKKQMNKLYEMATNE